MAVKQQPATEKDADDEICWIEADKDYAIALKDGKLVSRNPKGKTLASVPKWLKDSEHAQQLVNLKDWLAEHQQQCQDNVELWMLRSLPVPRSVLAAVWPDATWRSVLENAVVCSVTKNEIVQEESGFLKDVDSKRGVGIVDLDGETQWLKAATIAIPHPILLQELNDFRELIVELDFKQALDQLFRQTWQPTDEQLKASTIDDYNGGKFEQLNHCLSLCRRLGYKVSGGYACCSVWEDGRLIDARFWVGAEYPEAETYTSDLIFTDAQERTLKIKDVGPVAFSEGMRMAAAIYAKRVVDQDSGT